ncbi:unnamed protein product (macronuclear) [Paramecium tetraurelia]|uniref:Transmembrane protein n=1 Tax=Paramecium tetraurelia TaxID=5888 RepID=A0DUX7_PARTE|nr:uncharacterized protein GSPATT00020506001 [Paramecium tetraurelia]CAK86844.1 unnamed protein product [Paramecium tetraurelia]|eukprot:XP_001454241.1 hypothetical protein (macronuclear) [Paramecium tetraurelia strain d4-2]
MQQDKEIDFIRRKYWWHLFVLFLTFSMVALILESDIRCITSELDLNQLICTILELIFCLLVFILTCMELRYFYKVKNDNFSFTYSSIISQGCLKVIIVCLSIIYLTNLIIELIYDVQLTSNQRHRCHYFGFTNQILQFVISGIILICQLVMMFVPYKILKTLILLSNQKQYLFEDILISDLEGDFEDITANNGNYCIIKTQKKTIKCVLHPFFSAKQINMQIMHFQNQKQTAYYKAFMFTYISQLMFLEICSKYYEQKIFRFNLFHMRLRCKL